MCLAALVLAIGCGQEATRPSASGGTLLLTSGEGTATEIYAIRPDGSGRRQLTRNAFQDGAPDWSPDGRRIVFESARDSTPGHPGRHPEIFVMNADGSGEQQLTDGDYASGAPRWSPDGTRIVFHRFDATNRARVFVMRADGTDVRPLTQSAGEDFSPTWAPDGHRILYLSNRAPRYWWTMYVAQADGSGERQLAGDEACPGNVIAPRWSPDGTRIAYTCDGGGVSGLYVIGADGANPVRVSDPARVAVGASDVFSVWSPDGRRLAFTGSTPEGFDLFVMTASGGGAVQITRDPLYDAVAAWSDTPSR